MDTETIATTAVKSRIAETERLSQYINERDKEPIWDGHIYAYHNKRKTNDNFIGRAPVQVKGKKVKEIAADGISFSVKVTNLESYRNDGGVFYFVVYFTEDKQRKIYYASLLPYVLNQYIKIAHGKTFKVPFKSLPDKDNDFENLVINFINERKRQLISRNGKNWTLEEVIEFIGPNNIQMNFNYTCIGYDRKDPFSYLKDNDIYLYAGKKDGSWMVPVQHISNIDAVSSEIEADISINGINYYDSVVFERNKEFDYVVKIGKSIELLSKSDKCTLKYNLKGNLDERINTIQFLLAFIDEKGFMFNGIKQPFEPTEEELNAVNVEGIKRILEHLLQIKAMLSELGIEESLELESVTEKQSEYIEMLIRCIIKGELITFKEKGNIPPLGTISIGNLRVILLFHETEDGKYEISDFFKKTINCELDREGKYDTSQYCILKADDYLMPSNMDLSIIEKSFMEHHNEGHYERLTQCTLEMIKAYDIDDKLMDVLKVAESLNKWLLEEQPDSILHIINLYQCYARERSLTENEKKALRDMIKREGINNAEMAGIYILLKSKELAKMYLEELDQDKMKEFMNYPIYHLYEEMN